MELGEQFDGTRECGGAREHDGAPGAFDERKEGLGTSGARILGRTMVGVDISEE